MFGRGEGGVAAADRASEGPTLLCFGRLLFGARLLVSVTAVAPPSANRCTRQQVWPLQGARGHPRRSLLSTSAGRVERREGHEIGRSASGEHRDLLWFGRGLTPLLAGEPAVAMAVVACSGQLDRCFLKALRMDGKTRDVEVVEQKIWFHNPVRIVELPLEDWRRCRRLAEAVDIETPVLWNGQDTTNIFHLLVSFLGRSFLHARAHFPEALRRSADSGEDALLYNFDLHAGRPFMFGDDGSPLVPGEWATEFARQALPGMRITHTNALAARAPALFFRLVHFNLVNWASWILPSEDLYPPRISRRGVGPHPQLVAMPRAVKSGLGIREEEGDNAVLMVRRSAPAGRRLTNEGLLVEALQRRGVKVRVADLSLMLFAAQVEAVAHASVLFGAHGQGLFNLVFLPRGGGVVEVPPCGAKLALVYNVAEVFGFGFSELLDTSCDETFLANFSSRGCRSCEAREVLTAGGASDLDSPHVGDCGRIAPACDVRSVQEMRLNNVERAADIVQGARQSAVERIAHWRSKGAGAE